MTDDGVMSFPPYRNSKKIPTVTFPTSHDQQPDQAAQPRPVSVMAATDDGVTSFPPYWNTKKILTVTLPISHDHRVPTLGAICRTDDELFMPSLYEEKALTDDEVLQPPQKRRAAALRPSIRPSILASRMPSNLPCPIMPSNLPCPIMPSNLPCPIMPCKMVSILSQYQSNSEPKTTLDQQQHVNPVTISVSHFPQAPTVRGSFHQGDRRFGINSNKQCVANSLMAILMCKIKNVLSWSVTDLDQVLLNGDNLYSTIRDAGRIRDASGYLFVRDLPTEYTLNGVTFEIKYHNDMFVGLFGVSEYGDMRDVLMSADEAVRSVFSRFEACLFTIKVNTCALIKQGSWYVVIDSHSRREDGTSEALGRSILAYHSSLDSLLNHIAILGLSLDATGEQFEITAVSVSTESIPQQHSEGNSSSVTRLDQLTSTPETGYGTVRLNVTDDEACEDNVYAGNEADVVFIGELHSEQFSFSPLTTQQQRRLSCKLGVVYVEHGHVDVTAEFPMGDPCRTMPITGDGNCFFRSVAFAITGSEREHRKIRCAVVAHMLRDESRYAACLREGHSSVTQYVAASRMKYVGTWASEVEIQAAANLLGVHIFTYSHDRWLKYSTCLGCDSDQMGIYLKHCNESHYEAVTCVKRHDADGCAATCSQIATSDVPSSCRRRLERQKRRYECLLFTSLTPWPPPEDSFHPLANLVWSLQGQTATDICRPRW
ncbi:uncharacterized protein [Paramormyrops kingsleyae]|uniref:uncharacterized protein isoform X3 n=1 Tax=Paramormyrops kingsleyae TaxID=1676925 RepID=UPI003B97CD8A